MKIIMKKMFAMLLIVSLIAPCFTEILWGGGIVQAANSDWDTSVWNASGWNAGTDTDGKTVYTATSDYQQMYYTGKVDGIYSVSGDFHYNESMWEEAASGVFVAGQDIFGDKVEWYADYRADANAFRLRRNNEYVTYAFYSEEIKGTDWYHMEVTWDETDIYVSVNNDVVLQTSYAAYGDKFESGASVWLNQWGQPMSVKNLKVSCEEESTVDCLSLENAYFPEGSSGSGNVTDGWIIDNIYANNMLVIPYYLTDFTLEADVEILEGDWAIGLGFGISDKDSPATDFMAASVNPSRNQTWMFRETDQATFSKTGSLEGIDVTQKMHLKIVVSGQTFSFYLNDMETPNITETYAKYTGGYVALTSALTKVKFTNASLQVPKTEYETLSVEEAYFPEGSSGSGNITDGWIINNIMANNMLVLPHDLTDFTLETDVEVLEGDWSLGIGFGIPDKDSPATDFMAAHVNPGRNNTWMFRETDQAGLNFAGNLNNVDTSQKMHLKLEVRGKIFLFYVNDMKQPNIAGCYANYEGGYVAVMSGLTKTKFTNLTLSAPKAETDIDNGEISLEDAFFPAGSTGSGNAEDGWIIDNIYANNMVVFPHYLTDFEMEADVEILEGDWALGFGFGISDKNSPASDFMAVHVNPGRNNTWMFRETDQAGLNYSGSLEGIDLTNTLHLKLVVSGEVFSFYVNDMENPNVTGSYADYEGGYVALMSALTKTKFSNVVIKGTEKEAPKNSCEGIIVPAGSKVAGNPEDGYTFANTNNNNFGVFDTYAETLEFTTDVEFISPGSRAAGILFGVDNPYTCANWSAVHLQPFTGGLRVFSDMNGIEKYVELPNVDFSQKIRLKLVIDNDARCHIYVNDMTTPVLSASYPNYEGGYVGFNSSLCVAKFSNFEINTGEFTEPELVETDLGTITEGNISVFEPKVMALDYEAKIDLAKKDEAGLVVGISERENPEYKFLTVKLLEESKKVKIYTKDGIINQTINVGDVDFSQPVFVKVTMDTSDNLAVFVGNTDTPVYKTQYTGYNGGYVGLINNSSETKFMDIKLLSLAFPLLTDIKLIGAEMESDFSADTLQYHIRVENDVESVKIIPYADERMYITVRGKEVASGQESKELSLNPGYNALLVSVSNGRYETSYNVSVYREFDDSLYNETYRPQFHFSASHNWINDPNGLVYNPYTKEYHMFYQYNPYGMGWGNMSWGHAVSRDLVNWEELPIAIYSDQYGNASSGSCVIDVKNTSGLFDESTAPENRMVALYTHNTEMPNPGGLDAGWDYINGRQQQALAYSEDGGLTWKKYEGNPVLPNEDYDKYGRDFRDPKIIWIEDDRYENGGIWLMVIAGGTARLYTSPDLIHWTYNSEVLDENGNAVWTECPDLFPLTVEGTNETKWVYVGFVTPNEWYLVGDLVYENGVYTFKAETPQITYNGGNGRTYATQSFYNDAEGRRLLVSWLPDSDIAVLDKIWNGLQSIPMETKLHEVDGEYIVSSYPIEEVESLRSDKIYEANNLEVGENDANILKDLQGAYYDIEAIIDPGTASTFGFKLRIGNGFQVVKYDVNEEKMYVNTNIFNGNMKLEPTEGGKVKLRILVDSYVLDAFGNDGLANFICMFQPDTVMSDDGLEFFVEGGSVNIDSLNIYEMESAWNNNTLLENLEISDNVILSPSFSEDVLEYNATVSADVESIKIKPTYAVNATLTINGNRVATGDSEEIVLSVGMNKITIVVTKRNEEPKTYTINIKREEPELKISGLPEKVEVGDSFTLNANVKVDTSNPWSYTEGMFEVVINEDGSATFKALKVGEFVISYVTEGEQVEELTVIVSEKTVTPPGEGEKPDEGQKPGEGEKPDEGQKPQTGDYTNVAGIFTVMLLAAVVIIAAGKKRRILG